MGIVRNYCQYGVLYLGSYYNTGPYINFPHFGNSNLGKLSYAVPMRPVNRNAPSAVLSLKHSGVSAVSHRCRSLRDAHSST